MLYVTCKCTFLLKQRRVFPGSLTGKVGLEAAFDHELSDDVDRFSPCTQSQQLNELWVVQVFQCMDLLHKFIQFGVLYRQERERQMFAQQLKQSALQFFTIGHIDSFSSKVRSTDTLTIIREQGYDTEGQWINFYAWIIQSTQPD